jgi:hypothetical protein
VDVSNPSSPRAVGNLHYNFPLRDIEWYGDRAYAVGSDNSIQIINLSNPYTPLKVGSFSSSGTVNNLAVKDGMLYFADRSAGLKIYSLANPSMPAHLATLPIDYKDPYGMLTPNGVEVFKHFILVHGGSSIAVVDVQNPSNPVQVSVFDGVPSSNDDLITIGDQVFLGGSSGIFTVNLANPQSPIVTQRPDLPVFSSFSGATEKNNLFLSTPDLYKLTSSASLIYTFTYQNKNQIVTMNSPQDSVSYSFAPNTFNPGFFSHTPMTGAQSPAVHPGLRRVSTPFKNNRGGNLSLGYQVQMTYTNAQINGILESSLALYYWDGLTWLEEPTSNVNENIKTISANPERTGIWMVAGIPEAEFNETGTSIMLPIVLRPSNLDLVLAHIEITQSIQNNENSLPLVQNRPTVLRAVVRTNQPGGTRNVFISVSATRDGQILPGSPLSSGPWTIRTASSRGLFESTPAIHLPQDWLIGNVSLTVRLDANNHFAENNESNNEISVDINFNPVPPLHIVIVPVRYTHTPTGQVFEPITYDSISWHNMEVFPIPGLTVEMHSPINFSGSLPNPSSWSALLNTINSVKNNEGRARGIIYYGVVTNEIFAGLPNYIAGLGMLGFRASTGIDSFDTMAHEIGHNFGLEHTFENPHYPYSSNRIGGSGFNIFTNSIYPGELFADLMSYNKDDKWISDYYYLQVYNNQRQYGLTTQNDEPEQTVMVVSGTISSSGSVDILPVYTLPALNPILSKAGSMQVVLVGKNDLELGRYPVEVFQIAHEEDQTDEIRTESRFDAILPQPDQPVVAVHIYEGDILVAERLLHSDGPPSLQPQIRTDERSVELSWLADEQPVLVRVSFDDGKSWEVLAIDLVGGHYPINPDWFPTHLLRFQVIPADRGNAGQTGFLYTEVNLDQINE